MSWSRSLLRSRALQVAIGVTAAEYLRLVWKTGRFVTEPADIYERVARDYPVILAMWHGQHYLAPFLKRPEHRAKVLVSKHRDGEVNAIAARWLGVDAIRGSGHQGVDFIGKGGVSAFKEMLSTLQDGSIVALTADVPTVARVAGLGIVKLASASGRPIYPVALATHRRIELDTWDRTAINLPFARGAGVVAEPIWVASDADANALELARSTLQAALERATTRAYELVDRA
ncbi:MAG TPA: lysophospholipid acyltransferase family protein [Xanthobacteraceae bacterium]|jgi:lysophospholipid acyltransferase (LPLAT)-like uncharacterized protein